MNQFNGYLNQKNSSGVIIDRIYVTKLGSYLISKLPEKYRFRVIVFLFKIKDYFNGT